MVLPYKTDAGSVIYAVDVASGAHRALTEGPADLLPTLAPDRRTMTYGLGPAPQTLLRWDLTQDAAEPFFPESEACHHALRPGWSIDGRSIALVCIGEDNVADGIWVAGADGSRAEQVVDDSLVRGSPTWISRTEFVFGRAEDASEDAAIAFWRGFADGRTPEPFDVGVPDDAHISHADWSAEAERLLFLVSPPGGDEVGSVWTVDADGGDAQPVAEGTYAHPVWSPDGDAVGLTVVDLEADTEVLGYVSLDDPGNPVVVPDPPPGDAGVPVWGSR